MKHVVKLGLIYVPVDGSLDLMILRGQIDCFVEILNWTFLLLIISTCTCIKPSFWIANSWLFIHWCNMRILLIHSTIRHNTVPRYACRLLPSNFKSWLQPPIQPYLLSSGRSLSLFEICGGSEKSRWCCRYIKGSVYFFVLTLSPIILTVVFLFSLCRSHNRNSRNPKAQCCIPSVVSNQRHAGRLSRMYGGDYSIPCRSRTFTARSWYCG